MAMEVLRNAAGGIDACCEWLPFTRQGVVSEEGTIIGIANFVVARGIKVSEVVKIFARRVLDKNPQAVCGYFFRRMKRPGSGPRLFSRACWEKIAKGGS